MAGPRLTKIAAATALIAGGGLLTACGGGGGSSTPAPTIVSPSPPPPPANQAPTWTQGVFEPASTFKDQCAVPRSGVDIEGNAFPDEAGSLIEELFWLRSWTDETYLWNNEVTDQDPSGFSDRLVYFEELKTFAVTPSGEDKDDFHFSESTEEYLERRNSVGNPGYGAEFAVLQGGQPRDIRVAYSEPDSPASRPIGGVVPLPRGSKILEINGNDVVNGFTTQNQLNLLIELLYPTLTGSERTFRVEDVDGTIRTFTLTTEDIVEKPVLETSVIPAGTDKVGYILFNTFGSFSAEEEIILAVEQLETEGVTDLVLDLRYNGGGFLAIAAQLGYMIAGPTRTNGKDFQRFIYNVDAGNTDPVSGDPNRPFPFIDEVLGFVENSSLTPGATLPALDLGRVFILTTGNTCSASEAVVNGLRGADIEVILIGNTTCGKPYGFTPQDNCGETYYTIQFQGANDKGFGDFANGFKPSNSSATFGVSVPGCVVADDFSHLLGDEDEALLATALSYRTSGICPSTTSPSMTAFVSNKLSGDTDVSIDLKRRAYFLDATLDLGMPE